MPKAATDAAIMEWRDGRQSGALRELNGLRCLMVKPEPARGRQHHDVDATEERGSDQGCRPCRSGDLDRDGVRTWRGEPFRLVAPAPDRGGSAEEDHLRDSTRRRPAGRLALAVCTIPFTKPIPSLTPPFAFWRPPVQVFSRAKEIKPCQITSSSMPIDSTKPSRPN